MIFLIKHRWYRAVAATVIFGGAAWLLGGWRDITGGPLPLPWQVIIGLGGGCAALAINGALHELLKRALGSGFETHFQQYAADILGRMRWPEYIAAGLMAAIGEEPLFRGIVLRAFANPILGIAVSALVFAACHWTRFRYFGYWLWAMWERILFGILLVATGALLVPILAHGLHDVVGYLIFQQFVRKRPGCSPRSASSKCRCPTSLGASNFRPASCTLLVLFGGQMCHVLTSRSFAA